MRVRVRVRVRARVRVRVRGSGSGFGFGVRVRSGLGLGDGRGAERAQHRPVEQALALELRLAGDHGEEVAHLVEELQPCDQRREGEAQRELLRKARVRVRVRVRVRARPSASSCERCRLVYDSIL